MHTKVTWFWWVWIQLPFRNLQHVMFRKEVCDDLVHIQKEL